MATQTMGTMASSAARWGPLWGARPEDWLASEDQQVPTYEAALERTGLRAGQSVLDIGCGGGAFLQLVVERGGVPSGIDAAETLIDVARRRLPQADLRVGDMEALPYADDAFDLVTGFNAFFFANDIVAAVREAGRVAKPGAPVVIQVWGAHDRCDLEAVKEIIRPYMPPRPADAPPDPDLSGPRALEQLAVRAGLTPEAEFTTVWAYRFADDAALGRAMMAPAGVGTVVGPEREDEVRSAMVAGMAPFRSADGSYRLENEFRLLMARA
jgi:SAM-dependent methyltransferase